MYLVTNRTPSTVISTEFWFNQIGAEIKRDFINSQSSENSGAILEEKLVSGMGEIVENKIEIEHTWSDYKSLSDISFELQLSDDQSLTVTIDAHYTIDQYFEVEWEWDLETFSYQDQFQTETVEFTPTKTVIDTIKMMISEHMGTSFFEDYESEDIASANSRAFDDSHPQPITL